MSVRLATEIPVGLSPAASTTRKDAAHAVSIGGRQFLTDISMEKKYRRQSARSLREQVDDQREAGEQSLGDGWWRRVQEDFSGGAGQVWLDRDNSDRTRFHSSKGIDVFTFAPEATLLKDAGRNTNMDSANTNLLCLRAESGATVYLYIVDGQSLKRTTDPFAGTVTLTAITGLPAATILSAASSGQDIYTAYAADGIKKHALSGTAGAAFSAQNAELVRWVKERLMAANDNVLYEVSAAGTATARITHDNSEWTWTDLTHIGPAILAAGYVGERSTIYRLNVQTDGTLGAGIEATEGGFPEGEIVRCLASYLGYVLIGTNKGVRFATHDESGNLTYGPLVPLDVTVDVRCFEPQGSFVWFGWTNYDASSTGLGRLDLRTFTATLRPAYASDLMYTGQGSVLAVATHTDKRVFAVSAVGFISEKTTYVASGTLRTSRMGFKIQPQKIAKQVGVNAMINGGTITPSIAGSDDVFAELGPISLDDGETTANSTRSGAHSLSFELEGAGGLAPRLRHWTLKALPGIEKQRIFTVPLLLYDYAQSQTGETVGHSGKALEDLEFLELLEDNADTVAYEDLSSRADASRSFDVVIEALDFHAEKAPEMEGIGGVCWATLRKVD